MARAQDPPGPCCTALLFLFVVEDEREFEPHLVLDDLARIDDDFLVGYPRTADAVDGLACPLDAIGNGIDIFGKGTIGI